MLATRLNLTLSTLIALVAFSTSHSAPVTPNPKSLLKDKRVLIVEATNWDPKSGHALPKAAALKKLNLIKTAVGIKSFTIADNIENYTLAVLNQYDVVVFNYCFNTQLAVGKPFEKAFKQWLAAGNKGWMGYHTSGANDDGEWNWYRDSVTTMRYHVHTVSAQPGTINITKDGSIRSHPILSGMDTAFTGTDEWYDFDLAIFEKEEPPLWVDAKVMYYLDESKLATKPLRPMNPHPIAWFREDNLKNRFFYAGFIHTEAGVNSDFFHSTLLRALEYVAGYETGTPISVDGNSIKTLKNMSFVTASRTLLVDLKGAYALSIWTPEGKKVFSKKDFGQKSFQPDAFLKSGYYYIKLNSKTTNLTQRILIY